MNYYIMLSFFVYFFGHDNKYVAKKVKIDNSYFKNYNMQKIEKTSYTI